MAGSNGASPSAGSKAVVDLTDDVEEECVRNNLNNEGSPGDDTLGSLKAALKEKRREREEAERKLRALREEEKELAAAVRELEDQEESERRERNRPNWAATFDWDDRIQELLHKTFKLPHFRQLQREVALSI